MVARSSDAPSASQPMPLAAEITRAVTEGRGLVVNELLLGGDGGEVHGAAGGEKSTSSAGGDGKADDVASAAGDGAGGSGAPDTFN